MKKHKIDDLFQQKLAGSEFTPSPVVWSKLESQLAKKKRKGIIFYISIAASIALLMTFGWLIWKSQKNTLPTGTIAQSNTGQIVDIATPDSVQTQTIVPIIKEEAIEQSKNPAHKTVKKEGAIKKKMTPKKGSRKPAQKKNPPLIIVQQESNLAKNNAINKTEDQALITEALEQRTQETIAVNIQEDPVKQPSKESGSIKLVYTLKPAISSEIIEQQVAIKDTKESNFKKAVAFAKNIKENPKGIGNLREAKNNLLSFNKKKNDSK